MKVEECGVDTWSVSWYLAEGSPGERAMEALATIPTRRGAMSGRGCPRTPGRMVPSLSAGVRRGAAGRGFVGPAERSVAHGRASRGSAWRSRLRLDKRKAADRWYGDGSRYRRPGRAGVRRLDVTANVGFEKAGEGLSV